MLVLEKTRVWLTFDSCPSPWDGTAIHKPDELSPSHPLSHLLIQPLCLQNIVGSTYKTLLLSPVPSAQDFSVPQSSRETLIFAHSPLVSTRQARKRSLLCIWKGENDVLVKTDKVYHGLMLSFTFQLWNIGIIEPRDCWQPCQDHEGSLPSDAAYIVESRTERGRETRPWHHPALSIAWTISGLFRWNDELPLLLKSV